MGSRPAKVVLPAYVRILGMIEDGLSLAEIARRLNAEGVPTARGGRWYPSTIRAIRDSKAAANL